MKAGTVEFRVDEKTAKRLDTAIAEADAGITRSQAKNLIDEGKVFVDNVLATKAGMALLPGQQVRIEVPTPEKLELTPHDVGITILHEDDDLAVLEKPPGISVHPSDTETAPTVVHGLLLKLKNLSSVGGQERPGIVHRIDKGTSGILVVSKNDAAHLHLSAQFKEHTIDRRYRALVYGTMKNKGRIETFFGRNPSNRKKMTGKLTEGRKAVTHWEAIENFARGWLTLVDCKLETGRTHQIRVHLTEAGHPLVGDPLYGDNERKSKGFLKAYPELARACSGSNRQMLHAYRLGFIHPRTSEKLVFESKLPADFQTLLDMARAAG